MKLSILASAALLVIACGEKRREVPVTAARQHDSVAAPKQYFPVVNFLRGEIAYVDSLPVGIKKYTVGSKKGYTYIKAGEFHRLAAEFTPNEITDSQFAKQYQETSFFDKGSNSATFFYTTKNPSLPVQRVDVLTMKGDVYDHVKSIYLQKNYRSGDTGYIKKLYWKPQRSFQIITQATTGSQEPVTEIVNVVWDNQEGE